MLLSGRRARFARSFRLLIVTASGALVLAGAPPLQNAVQAAATAAPASATIDDTSRPDSRSALATAQATGHRVEDLSQHTQTARVFANPDGTWTADSTTEPAYVQDAQGEWHDVDPTLVERDGEWEPEYAATDLVLSPGGDKTFASVTQDGQRVDWGWPATLPAPVIDGNVATYPNAVPGGGDLVVTATATGFSHDIVLHHPPQAVDSDTDPSWTIPIATHGADLDTTDDGGLAITDPGHDDKQIATAEPPVMYDAAGLKSGQDITDPALDPSVDPTTNAAPLETTVGQNAAGTPTVTLTADKNFLTDPNTVYPVVIDPTFTTTPSGDTWVDTQDPTRQHASSVALEAGYNGTYAARSFLAFDWTAVNNLSDDHVISASLELRNYTSLSCAGSDIRAQRITEPWTVGINWDTQPGFTTSGYASYTPAHGGTNCATDWATWDVSNIVSYWAAHPTENYGIRIKAADETSTASYREYRAVNYDTTSYRPTLSVTYSPPPNPPTGLFAVDGQPLSALVSNDNVTVNFVLVSASGTTTTVKSGQVNAGQRATATLPSGLAAGRYTIKATTNDGYLNSASATTTTLVVNPAAVALADSKAIATQAVMSGEDAMTGDVGSAAAQTDDAAAALQDDADIPAPTALQEATAAQPETADHLGYIEDLAATYTDSGLEIDDSGVTVSIDSAVSPTTTTARIELTATYTQTIDDVSTGDGDKYVTASGALASLNPAPEADDEDDTSAFDDTYVANFTFTPHDVSTPDGAEVLAYYIPTLTDLTQAPPTDDTEGDDDSAPSGETPGTTETEPSDPATSPPDTGSGDSLEGSGDEGADGGDDGSAAPPFSPDPDDALIDDTSEADGQPLTAAQVDGTTTSSPSSGDGSDDSLSSAQSTSSYPVSYNRLAVAKYALAWTNKSHRNKMNGDYPQFNDNCANLVSQALRAGGWSLDGHVWDSTNNLSIWHYNLPGPLGATYTWAGAKYLFRYGYEQKHLNAVKYLENLSPGDLMFFDWHQNGSINHAMVVTGRTKKGMPMLSGKTNNRHNIPWATFSKIANKKYGSFWAYGLGHLKTS